LLTWLIHIGHDSFIWDINRSCVTWQIAKVFEMIHSYGPWLVHMGHDSFIRDMADSQSVWQESFIWDMTRSYVTWQIAKVFDRTHSYWTWLMHMGHDSFIRDMADRQSVWHDSWHMRHDSSIHDMTRSYMIWQIGKVFETVAAGSLTVLTVYGGVPYDQQGNGLRAGNFFPGIFFPCRALRHTAMLILIGNSRNSDLVSLPIVNVVVRWLMRISALSALWSTRQHSRGEYFFG